MLILVSIIGGTFAIWILQGLLDWAIIGRVMDDPVKGKLLSTVTAYVLACVLYGLGANSPLGIFLYLPGAVIVGFIEFRGGKKIQARIDERDEAATFE